jgi:ribokinase
MKSSRPRIVVLGSANTDLVVRVPHLPAPGETIAGGDFHTLPGGKGANQAVAAARQGAEVYFIGAIGGDDFGARLCDGLARDGIDLKHLAALPGVASGVAMIVLDALGQNTIVLSPGANARVTPAQVEAAESVIRDADVLLCQLETPLPAVLRAIEIAQVHGVIVMLNPAPAQPLETSLLARVAYLLPNETEAALLTGLRVTDVASAGQAAARLRTLGARRVLVTLGGQGVLIAEDEASSLAAALTVQVVDTTGAGDTFVGCFAVAIAEGRTTAQAVCEAQCAAALKVTRLGAQNTIPRRDEVRAFMRQQGKPVADRSS